VGLHIHSLAEMPVDSERSFVLYFLDYGWDEPLSNALRNNFARAADMASRGRFVVVRGTSSHFADEVLSWHGVNGRPSSQLLPALLVTNGTPAAFKGSIERFDDGDQSDSGTRWHVDERLVLIPLKELCASESDVVSVIQRLIEDIESGAELRDFRVAEEMRRGEGESLQDALVLQPNISGIGVDIPKLWSWLSGSIRRWRGRPES